MMLAVALPACQDDVDAPNVDVPVASQQANISILELKTLFWNDAVNYADTIMAREDGSHYIIKGRVVSTDEESNIYKSLVIQDETAAMAFSINSYNLYLKYRRGQEIVVDVTGMYIGKYNGLQQIGMREFYEQGNVWEVSFMSPELFDSHTELNGLPEVEKIDTLVVNSFDELPTGPEGLRATQSQIVRFNNVEFQNGGVEQFSTYQSSGVNQNIVDVNGSSLPVRTSGYSTFWSKTLPTGRGDVVAICSYYGTTGWQLMLNGYNGCMNFGNPTVAPGTEDNPYTVDEVVAFEQAEKPARGWVTGYIVGVTAPEIEEANPVKSNDDIEWTGTPSLPELNYSLVIGATAETKDISNCLVIALPAGSDLRKYGNLVDNSGNYKKQIWVSGTFEKVYGTYGVANNRGTASEFKIEGVTIEDPAAPGDGTEAKPYNCSQVIGGATGTEAWVKGYIVGWVEGQYLSEGAHFDNTNVQSTSNILVADNADETNVANCVPVQLPAGSVRNALNLQANPGNYKQVVALKGSLEKYYGAPGLKTVTDYKLNGGSVTPPTPVDPVSSIDENFDASLNMPAGWTQVQIAGNKDFYVREFSGNNYVSVSGYQGNPPFDMWLLTPPVDLSKVTDKTLSFDTQVNGYGSTTTQFEVYVLTSADVATANKTKLNPTLPTPPASGYSSWVNSGDLSLAQFSGIVYIGFRYYATQDANYATWGLDNVKVGKSGSDTPNPPTPPAGDFKGDFNSFNGGAAKASPYGTYTNATGWTAENSIILSGTSGDDKNPAFKFIGDSDKILAVCLNGKASTPGRVFSPALTGGCGKLTFNYGFAYSDTKCSFTVKVSQNGAVVKEQTVSLDSIEKFKVYDFSLDVNVSGEFTIEIVNNCISASTSNKDRVAIWNLTWTD